MSINRQVGEEVWYVYTTECYSAIKMNEIMSFVATWMDLEIIILSKSEKDKYGITYMYNLKTVTQVNLLQTSNGVTDLEKEPVVTGGGEGWGGAEFGVVRAAVSAPDGRQRPPSRRARRTCPPLQSSRWEGFEKECTPVRVQLNHFAVLLKLTQPA